MESKSFAVVSVAVLVSAVAGAAAGALVSSRSRPQAAGETRAASPADAGRLSALEARAAELAQSLELLRAELRTAPLADTRVAVDDSALDEALARYLARRPAALGDAVAPAVDEAAAARAHAAEVADAFRRLLDPALGEQARQSLWREFAAKGLLEELVAQFEQRAELDPSNPDLQVELGAAYLQKVFAAGNSPEAGVWAMKADGVFDAALELDDEHWNARFHKAVSLSFWPPMFGKQKEAIAHFETLVAQQAGQAKESGFAQTHLFLGNMYLQMGEKAKALAAWESGLAQYPDNAELRKQVELNRAP